MSSLPNKDSVNTDSVPPGVDLGVSGNIPGSDLCTCGHVAVQHRLDARGNLAECQNSHCRNCEVFTPDTIEEEYSERGS
jgi:hypothetical protein